MKNVLIRKKFIWVLVSAGLMVSVFLMFGSDSAATQGVKSAKKMVQQDAYVLFKSKCLGCHISVADPEKPGRTRDDWHLVVNVMHRYGFDLTADEADKIIDLLYDLRKGMEREAG